MHATARSQRRLPVVFPDESTAPSGGGSISTPAARTAAATVSPRAPRRPVPPAEQPGVAALGSGLGGLPKWTVEMCPTIQQLVAAEYHINRKDMLFGGRPVRFATPRHMAMYLCRKYTGATCVEIASQFHVLDHGTVIHACRNVADWLATNDAATMRHYLPLTKQLEELRPERKRHLKLTLELLRQEVAQLEVELAVA